jgi:hypothetical protein
LPSGEGTIQLAGGRKEAPAILQHGLVRRDKNVTGQMFLKWIKARWNAAGMPAQGEENGEETFPVKPKDPVL